MREDVYSQRRALDAQHRRHAAAMRLKRAREREQSQPPPDDPDDDEPQAYLPTPEEIAEATRRIRETWDGSRWLASRRCRLVRVLG